MKIVVTTIFVNDQDRALAFYCDILGFIKKHDIPVGKFRWISLVSPENQDGVELTLEPNNHPAAKQYQKAIFEDGIPATMFAVSDIESEYKRLLEKGVVFTMPPTEVNGETFAIFDDNCGNLIQIIKQK